MDNQNPTPNPTPPTENIPVQNLPVQETPPSQVYTAPQPSTPPPSPKSFLSNKIILLIVILLIILGAGGTYLALKSKPKPQPTAKTEPTVAPTSAPTPTPDPTANWKTYTNNGDYSIKHPASWIIEDTVRENLSCALLGEEIAKSMTICFSKEKFSNVWPEYIGNPDKIKIAINGYDAYENAISPGAFFVLNSNEQWASISPAGLSDKRLFDQILSIFRFTNP